MEALLTRRSGENSGKQKDLEGKPNPNPTEKHRDNRYSKAALKNFI